MLPENRIPNTMGLSPQSSASMMGSMGDVTASAMPPLTESSVPTESPLQKVAMQFKTAWSQLEDLNGQFGGNSDKFRIAQKALEDWFADIATNIPETSDTSQNSTY